MKLVFYLCKKYYFGQCISAVGELCICQSVRIKHFSLCSQKVLKNDNRNVIEFQSSQRNVLMKIHLSIFVLKLSSVIKCFYHVSQLLLHDPSDLDNHFDFMNCVSVNFLS